MQVSLYMRLLHQENKVPICKIKERYPEYSRASIYRHCKKNITKKDIDGRKNNKGRAKSLTVRDERRLIRKLYDLREREISFTAPRLQLETGLTHCSTKTIHRTLKRHGFSYLQTRRKGRMTPSDLKHRVKFANDILKNYPNDFWKSQISFYLDGKSFIHKINPRDQAIAPKAREWRKKGEGLTPQCAAKGNKVGSGGRVAHFMVAISYNKGVIMCEQYDKMNGPYFADFVKRNFRQMFNDSINPNSRLFVQDGDPSQNSKAATKEIEKIGGQQISIPPRCPDLNPIENFFHLIDMKLRQDAIDRNITRENFCEYSERVRKTMREYPSDLINKIIETMSKRIQLLSKNKGQRLKY